MSEANACSEAISQPRILIEIRDGTVSRIVTDAQAQVITVDWDAAIGKPAV